MLSHSSDALTFRQLLPNGKHYAPQGTLKPPQGKLKPPQGKLKPPQGKLKQQKSTQEPNPKVRTCTDTIRRVVPGDVFFACVDGEGDGHDHLDQAVQNGAIAVVTERLVVCNVPVMVVDDCRLAFAQACHLLLGGPSQSLTTTAIAGTDGKTTVAALIEAVLVEAGKSVTSRTSLGITAPAGYAQRQTASSAADLAGWLAKAVGWGIDDAILEVDSRDAAKKHSAGAQFDHLVLTSANAAHLDLHRTPQNYQKTLWGLTQQLKSNGVLITNQDDLILREHLQQLSVPALTYSMKDSSADVHATLIERHRSEQTFTLEAGHHVAMVRTKIIGDQHIRNCLAAAAVGMLQGLDLTQIAKGLEKVERLSGRMDRVECGQPFGVFLEQHATPTRLSATLAALRSVTGGRLWCVFGSEATEDDCRLAATGRIVERLSDHCVLTGPTHETRGSWPLVHDVLDGMKRPGAARIIPTRKRAIHWVLDEAGPDDTILLVGAPTTTCPIESCGQADDRGLVERHLRDLPDEAPVILPFPTVR